MTSRIVFRADASLQIGTGHVMRCLTLADALAARGAECRFICREHDGNLIEYITNRGYAVHGLPIGAGQKDDSPHGHWLGGSSSEDAEASRSIVAALRTDWMIVDHYALDARWERALSPVCRRLLAIDDLADRAHACHALLDQTYGRSPDEYRTLVPSSCMLLCGSPYALLRPEFAQLRAASLARRAQPALKHLLVAMGGVDNHNVTARVLEALRRSALPPELLITVVLGKTAPHVEDIEERVRDMPWRINLLVGVTDMAQLMANSDLAIGAAGSTSWERCCLGLPSLLVVLAENQRRIAHGLSEAGAAFVRDVAELDAGNWFPPECFEPAFLRRTGIAAAGIADGLGASRVVASLLNHREHEDQFSM